MTPGSSLNSLVRNSTRWPRGLRKVIRRQFWRELRKVMRRSLSTPSLVGTSATGKGSVDSMHRLLFMRVIRVMPKRFFRLSQNAASMNARSTSHRAPL